MAPKHLWAIFGVGAVLLVGVLIYGLSQYNDDVPNGGDDFEAGITIFIYGGIVLIAVGVVAIVWAA